MALATRGESRQGSSVRLAPTRQAKRKENLTLTPPQTPYAAHNCSLREFLPNDFVPGGKSTQTLLNYLLPLLSSLISFLMSERLKAFKLI